MIFFSGVIFSPKCGCPLLYLGPSVPEILIGVIFPLSSLRPSVPETYDFTRKLLLLGRCYLPTCCCFPLYIFIQLVLFCLHVGSFSFLFQMCSSQGSGANSLPHSRIICSHRLAASRKQCLHQKRKVPFVLILLILSTGSFGLCLTVFATCLPVRFMLRPTYSDLF